MKEHMDIVVTGGAGFIGSALVTYHIHKGDTVHVIDDLSTGTKNNLKDVLEHPHFKGYFVDLRYFPNLELLLEKADIVYHFAAVVGVFNVQKEPHKVLEVNIQGTRCLLEAMRISQSKARLILASTSEIYGGHSKLPLSEIHDAVISTEQIHRSSYSISKLVDEAYAQSYYERYGIQITILRIFNVIGRYQTGTYGMVIPRFIQAAVHQQPLMIYGTGRQKRSFCDIRDFVSIIIQVVQEPATIGLVLNIGHDEEISIIDLAKRIIVLANSSSKMRHVPYDEVYGESFDDFKYRRPDLTRLKHYIRLNYRWTLNKSLVDLIAHAKKEQGL
ncbi:MAG: NAD-dependent epimerase/dehydratase family protein [Gammaproteobacteria bacterium]|nr:NAD-dependent epimerase/dehydratase family protein [Gammaproteobacteria bacterium]